MIITPGEILLAGLQQARRPWGTHTHTGERGEARPRPEPEPGPPCRAMLEAARRDAVELAGSPEGTRHGRMKLAIHRVVMLDSEGHRGAGRVLNGLEQLWTETWPGHWADFVSMEEWSNSIAAGHRESRPYSDTGNDPEPGARVYFRPDQGKRCSCDVREYVPAHRPPLASAWLAGRKMLAESHGWSAAAPGAMPDWHEQVRSAWAAYAAMLIPAKNSRFAFTARVKIPATATPAEIAWLASERLIDLDDPGWAVLLDDEVPAAEFAHCRFCGRDHEAGNYPGAPLDDSCPMAGERLYMGAQVLRIRAAQGGAQLTAGQMCRVMNSDAYRERFGLTGCAYASVKGVLAAQAKLRKAGQLAQIAAAVRVRYRHAWRLVSPASYAVAVPHPDAAAVAAVLGEIPLRSWQLSPPAARQRPTPAQFMAAAA